MLERYRDTKDKNIEDKNSYQTSKAINSENSNALGTGYHTSIEKLSDKEMNKIIEEDEEESDEDLSYLL